MDRALGNPLGNPLGLARSSDATPSGEITSANGIVFSSTYLPPPAFLPADGDLVGIAEYPSVYKRYGQSGLNYAQRTSRTFSSPINFGNVSSGFRGRGSDTGTWVICLSSGTNLYRMYRSIDDGVSWSEVAVGLNLVHVDTDNAGKWFAASSTNYYISTDDGLTWNEQGALPGQVTGLTYAGGKVYTKVHVPTTGYVRGSSDSQWVDLGLSLDTAPMHVAGDNAGNVILGCSNSAYISRDFGTTWTALALPITLATFQRVTTDGAGTWLVAVTAGGGGSFTYPVLLSTDNAASWSTVSSVPSSNNTAMFMYGDEGLITYNNTSGTTIIAIENVRNPSTRKATSYSATAVHSVAVGPTGKMIRTTGTSATSLIFERFGNYANAQPTKFQLPRIASTSGLRPFIKVD